MKKTRLHTAILTIYDLNTMPKKEVARIKKWLVRTAKQLDKEEYANTARFRLMK